MKSSGNWAEPFEVLSLVSHAGKSDFWILARAAAAAALGVQEFQGSHKRKRKIETAFLADLEDPLVNQVVSGCTIIGFV